MNDEIRAFVNDIINDGDEEQTVAILEAALKELRAATEAKKNKVIKREQILHELEKGVKAVWGMGVENIAPADVAAFATLGAAADHPDWGTDELNEYFGAIKHGVENINRAATRTHEPKQEKKVTEDRPKQRPGAPDVTVIRAESLGDAMKQLIEALDGAAEEYTGCSPCKCAKGVADRVKAKLPDSDEIEAVIKRFLDKLE